jgi:hypothetical protein
MYIANVAVCSEISKKHSTQSDITVYKVAVRPVPSKIRDECTDILNDRSADIWMQ